MSSTDSRGVQALLFATCPLPGCPNPTSSPGEPCDDCIKAFAGDSLIQLRRGRPLADDEIAERDAGIKAAYAAMRSLRIADGLEAKRNQICWLCEQRRTCTRQERGWECDDCRSIT